MSEAIVKLADGRIENAIDVWWQKPQQANYVRRFYKAKIYVSEDENHWALRGESTGIHFRVVNDIVDGQTYYVQVVTVTETGQEGVFDTAPGSSIQIVGKSAEPSNVASFLVNQNRDRLLMGWAEISDVDVWGYEIRGGSSWASAEVVAFVQGDKYLTTNFRTGTGQKYWIKALDTSGNYSATATEAEITIDNIPFQNLIEEYSEQTAWAGTKSNTTVSGVNLIISTGQLSGTYVTPVRDVGYVATFGIKIEVVTSISVAARFDDDSVTKFDSSATARFTGEESPGAATFEIQTSEDNVTWSGWAAFQPGDYKCRYFQIRMTLTRATVDTSLNCSQLDYSADLPDIDEVQDGEVTVAADGDDITFAKTFHETPALNITILTGTGEFWKQSSLDTAGVTIKLYNSSGVVTGTFRIHIHGV